MPTAKIQAVFFDLDGTLADTAADLGGALNRMLIAAGRPARPLTDLRPLVSGGARALLRAGFGITPEDAQYLQLQKEFLDIYEAHLCDETALFDGMPQLLTDLECKGVTWGIVTNKVERFTRQVVTGLHLDRRAAAVISGDSAPRPKPAPDPLLLACEKAGVSPDSCLYIGDDLRDVQAGKAAGMGTVIAAWGYLGDGLPIDQWGGDHIVSHPAEILGLLS